MYCKVIYYNERANGYSRREYTYRTELPLSAGDKVRVPVSNEAELKRAMVTSVNVPESEIGDSWRNKIKEITQMDN